MRFFGVHVGGAAIAQARVARDAKGVIHQAGDADKLRRRATLTHLRPVHIGTIGEIVHGGYSSPIPIYKRTLSMRQSWIPGTVSSYFPVMMTCAILVRLQPSNEKVNMLTIALKDIK